MGKNRDVIQILLIVILGMFIPFLGSIAINYGFDIWKISSTFGFFLLIFGFELVFVYLYYYFTNSIAKKKIDNLNNKK